MCGIIGAVSKTGTNVPSWFIKGRDKLHHRGPDHAGFWNSSDHRIFFGHTRLSIIDLSDQASQPMIDEENGNVIIFNGEIYNFREIQEELKTLNCYFKTESDTEVLLAAYKYWGEKFLNKIDGMFAFSIYDKSQNLILLARDRFGQKPLYFSESSSGIKFASQIKSLLADSSFKRELNPSSLSSLLTFGYNKSNFSLIKNLKKLPPGSFLKFFLNNNTKPKITNYWSLNEKYKHISNNFSDNDHVVNLNNIFEKNFKNYLISDVPLCILTSGGLDSSIMTAYAAKYTTSINTFHIKLRDHSNIEDTKNAKLISDYFSTNHYEIEIDFNTNIDFDKIFNSFDEPIFDNSIISTYLISEQISKKYKVAIGGDGGDELFGGYNKYQYLNIFESLQNKIPSTLLLMLQRFFGEISKKNFKNRDLFKILKNNLLDDRYQYQYFNDDFDYFNSKELNSDLVVNFKELTIKENRGNLIDSLMYDDLKSYLPNNILHKIDICSMSNSLEMRAPFLNNDLVDYALSYMHRNHKVSKLNKKIILKKLANKLLPNNFDINRKLGFSVPIDMWLKKGKFREYSFDNLISSNNFSNKSIKELFSSLDKGELVGNKIFSLLILEQWFKSYNIRLNY